MKKLLFHSLAVLCLALIFSFNGMFAQDCGPFTNPITEDTPLEDCCGLEVTYTDVCYDLSDISDLICEDGTIYLQFFGTPYGFWATTEAFSNLAGLTNFLNQFIADNGGNDQVNYDPATGMICASRVDDDGYFYLQLWDCQFEDKHPFAPILSTSTGCPTADDFLSTEEPADIEVFDGQISTNDVVAGLNTNVPGAPPANTIGNLFNYAFGSGLFMNGGECVENINCYADGLIEQVNSTEWGLEMGQVTDILGEGDPIELQETVAEELGSFFETVNNEYGGLEGLLNDLFGWELANVPCEGTGDLQPTNEGKPQSAAKNSQEGGTEADVGYLGEEIAGLGAGGNPGAPSPSAMSMIEAIKGGVDKYSGSQSSSIPLHTIVANDITVPIGLSSSNNGLKVDDIGSLVGQNWHLNAGGSISRVVKGLPDDFDGKLEGTGVGRDYKLVPRIQLPSNLGVRLDFIGSGNIPTTTLNKIRRGLPIGGGELGEGLGITDLDPDNPEILPIKLDIRW
ncbi:MAG: hypothetical protein AAF597_12890, partial [Bacteroidota bacterium]